MTAQFGDRIIIDGEKKGIMGYLYIPSKMFRLAREHDSFSSSTACWRGYVATWEVHESVVYLKEVAGRYRMASNEPVKASWLHEFVRIIDGDVVQYIHMGFESKYDAVLELDLSEGVVVRQRRVTVPETSERGISMDTPLWEFLPSERGISMDTPLWEFLPEAAVLFPPECHIERFYEYHLEDTDPTKGGPEYKDFLGRHLRPRVTAERTARGLKYGELVRLAGYPNQKGGLLAQWERGQKGIDWKLEERICAELGISDHERLAYHQKDCIDFETAWDAWADEPIIPMLKIQDNFNTIWYMAPVEYRNDSERLVDWAEACYKLTWRRPELIISRRKTICFFSPDMKTEQIRRRPKSPPKFKVPQKTTAKKEASER